MKIGTRHGTMAALMKPVVANLTDGDVVNSDRLRLVAESPRPSHRAPFWSTLLGRLAQGMFRLNIFAGPADFTA